MHRADPYRTNRPEWDQAALFPRRRKTRPQDIDLEPPDIRDVLAESWRRHQPRLLRIGRSIRRNWILLAGLAAAAIGIAMLDAGYRETVERVRREARVAELEGPTRQAIKDVLELIGHRVEVASLAFDSDEYAAAWYRFSTRGVMVNLDLDWEPDDLLGTICHECVHALFHQSGLSGYQSSLEHQLVEETAAEILGAHLAGRVLSARGGDGGRLTREAVAEYRALCDSKSPDNIRQRFLRRTFRERSFHIDQREAYLIMNHFGNERFVDEVDEICTRVVDPWDAAHEIAERYKLYFEWHPAVIPEP